MIARMMLNLSQIFRGIVTSRFYPSLSSFKTCLIKKAPKRILKAILYANSAQRKESIDSAINETLNIILQSFKQFSFYFQLNSIFYGSSITHPQTQIIIQYYSSIQTTRMDNHSSLLPSRKMQTKEEELQESTVSFRPFHIKFYRFKTHANSKQTPKERHLDFSGKSDEGYSKRVLTEDQTNDLYASDFQSGLQDFQCEETVLEQNQNQQYSIENDQEPNYGTSSENNSFEQLSSAQLNKKNQKLMQLIQFYRSVLPLYKQNSRQLEKQIKELHQLKNIKARAFDYSYELAIDYQYRKEEKIQRTSRVESKKISELIKKQKYKKVKQAERLSKPTANLQYGWLENEKKLQKFQTQREMFLLKKKQFYKRQEKIKVMEEKILLYKAVLDLKETALSKGNLQKLQYRKQYLKNDINTKKAIINSNQVEINLEITNLNHQLSEIQTKLMEIQLLKKNSPYANKKNEIKKELSNNSCRNKKILYSIFTKSNSKIKSKSKIHSLADNQSALKKQNLQKSPKAIDKFILKFKKDFETHPRLEQ